MEGPTITTTATITFGSENTYPVTEIYTGQESMHLQVSSNQTPLSPEEECKPFGAKPGQLHSGTVLTGASQSNKAIDISDSSPSDNVNEKNALNGDGNPNNSNTQMDIKGANAIITPISGDMISSTGTDSSSPHTIRNKNEGEGPGSDSWKVDINQIDQEVGKMLAQLERIEQKFNNLKVESSYQETQTPGSSTITKSGLKEIHNLIDNFKSTILRLNLKNTLVKNQLLSVKDDYAMERCMLLNRIENLEKALRITQDENDAVNSRNLKLIKYIRTLKNEKLKLYIAENRRLKEHIERLEQESLHNVNALRINHPQRYSSIPSPLNSTTSPVPPIAVPGAISMQHSMTYHEEEVEPPYHIRPQINSPTNFNMLDTLGRLATEYLHNEYPEEDKDERLERA